VYKVKTFTEKPNLDMARFFLQSGEFLWNSGIFVWNVSSIIASFEKLLPEVSNLFLEGEKMYNTSQETEFIRKVYSQCTNISIDYGVMEKAENVYVLPSEFGWSDLGTWGSLYEHSRKDENSNAVVGSNVMLYDSKNCVINMPKDKLVVLQGLDNYIIAESDGILLICRKEDEQEIKQFVNDVKISKGERFV
jgi:mannose-1-phosphate guanylyltransferase